MTAYRIFELGVPKTDFYLGSTWQDAGLDELLDKATNYTGTDLGAQRMRARFNHPFTTLREVRMAQEAVRTIHNNPDVRRSIEDVIGEVARFENTLEDPHSGNGTTSSKRRNIKRARKFLRTIDTISKDLATDDKYLSRLGSQLQASDRAKNLATQNLYFSNNEALPADEVSFEDVARLKVNPFPYKIRQDAVDMAGVATVPLLLHLFLSKTFPGMSTPGLITGGLTLAAGGIGMVAGMNQEAHRYQLARAALGNAYVDQLHALGELDVLLAFDSMASTFENSSLPLMDDSQTHVFSVTGLHNTIGAGKYVSDDVFLGGGNTSLTIITEPEPHGATAMMKSVIQSQVLAQMGAPIPAKKGVWISVADQVGYLTHTENKAELYAGMSHFFKEATERSLIVFDDTFGSNPTIEDQQRDELYLKGFLQKKANTIYVTRDTGLARSFERSESGRFLTPSTDNSRNRFSAGIANEPPRNLRHELDYEVNHTLKEQGYVD